MASPVNRCLLGDCRESMRTLIAEGVRVQTCVTSPPYWGLRDYGHAGQLGLESSPAEYVANMVEVFALVRDLLADDGTLWLNLGDSYATGAGGVGNCPGGGKQGDAWKERGKMTPPNRMPIEGLKPKDLCGIPWRVAFALQAAGWYLRSDIIWHKPNPMPESVTDRPTKSHEYLFLLAKSERYFYDADAIKEPAVGPPGGNVVPTKGAGDPMMRTRDGLHAAQARAREAGGFVDRNRRTVWTIPTTPYAEAHFATFPPALIEPCVLAGTSARGHCPQCGKGWQRDVERTPAEVKSPRSDYGHGAGRNDGGRSQLVGASTTTRGWCPDCTCGVDPVPGVVFDPFMGSGTVAQVAQDLGRRWLGCELNPEYVKLQAKRTAQQGLVLV
jgi:DNA modification methylase